VRPGTTVAINKAPAVTTAMITPIRRPRYHAVNAPTMIAGITNSI
jgi:hypothetical protein